MENQNKTDAQKIDLRDYLDKRLPIGVLLLAFAAFCIWRGRWPDEVGWLISAGCVGFFGLLAVGERHFAIVDAQAGVFMRKRGILFVITRASLAIADIKCVELTRYTVRSGDKGGRTTRYRISVNAPKSTALADYGNEWRARRLAENLSATLRVSFDNRVYGRRSVRMSNELDLPVAERWRVSGKIKERPAPVEGSRVMVDDQATRVRVYFPANMDDWKGVVLMALIFAAFGAFSYSLMDEFGGNWFIYSFLGFAFVFLFISALAFSGRSRLTFTDRSVSFRQGLAAPLERSIELQSIEEMIHGWDALYLVSDSASLSIDWPKSDQDQDFLKALVASEIARRHQMTAPLEP